MLRKKIFETRKLFLGLFITAIFSIFVMQPVLAVDSADAAHSTGLLPTSRGYGIKLFVEETIQMFTHWLPQKIEENYLLWLGKQRTDEFTSLVKIAPTNYQSALKALNGNVAYGKKLDVLTQKDSVDRYWEVQNGIASDFYKKMMGFDLWMRTMLLDHEAQAAYGEATNQLLLGMLAKIEEMRQAADRVAQERLEKIMADRKEDQHLASFLADWGEKRRELVKNLSEYCPDPTKCGLDSDIVAKMQKTTNDFADEVQKIKNSPALDKDQLQKALNNYNNDINNINKERITKAKKAAGFDVQPILQNNTQPASKNSIEKTNKPVVNLPQLKPTLKKIPSESVSTQKLRLRYFESLTFKVGEAVDLWYSGIGGLPPYHFQLGTGGGFPPQHVILDNNGWLSGTPQAEGNYHFDVCVVDIAGASACATTYVKVEKSEEPVVKPAPEPEPQQDVLKVTVTSVSCVHEPGHENEWSRGYYVVAEGTAKGPVGSALELPTGITGPQQCPSWHVGVIDNPYVGDAAPCIRKEGDPEETTWKIKYNAFQAGWEYVMSGAEFGDACQPHNPH